MSTITQELRLGDPSVLRWLHLTDLHIGKQNESQQIALGSLLTAIETSSSKKPFDIVFLTGDLAYSGKEEEYDLLKQLLIDPLRNNLLFKNAIFVATPGNHDLDCNYGLPPVWSNLGPSRQQVFFHFDDSGKHVRSSRSAGFKAYKDFIQKNAILSVDPTEEPACLFRLAGVNKTFSIISVVTAFFSDKEVTDRVKAPIPVQPIRKLIQESKDEDSIKIIVGHHPAEWFIHDTERHFHSLLVETNALYLHGHEHVTKSKFGGRGLVSLGFGAAYQAPPEAPPNPYYRNSFAICELSDSLHISVISWDGINGQWRPDQNLPGDFTDRSERLVDGYCLALPSTKIVDQQHRPFAAVADAIRAEVHFDQCIWLAADEPKRWGDLLSLIGEFHRIDETYTLPTQLLPAGHSQFRIKDQVGQHLVRAVSAHGDVLTYEHLESINTELDKQDYDSCIVITLGALSTDALTLADQLSARKPIRVLQRTDLVRRILHTLPVSLGKALSKLDPNSISGSLVITDESFAILLQESATKSWFQVLNAQGELLAEASSLVSKLKEDVPSLRVLAYKLSDKTDIKLRTSLSAFDRKEYLKKSYLYFDDVKYAPLAALGFRFKNASLSEIYVDASADVGDSSKSSQSLTRAVSEFIDSLNLPKAQKDQLESQLRSQYGLDRSAEVGAARQLYQRFNNVLVLGDPGSGKTCFVKHEILAYCNSASQQGSWYAYHLPVYLSLAEAARLINADTDLLQICEIVSSRRGIALPKEVIENALAEGRCAFFFDGLDEVGYLDKRIALVGQISKLVEDFVHLGNRFVLASRPAAVQPVDIPENLTPLQLKGLTETEMRILAARVLTVRVGQDEENDLTKDEKELIEKLLEDTRNSPGIARIASNPLLLTLLVLIYANTGALSARRHLIYAQAIKTLVSVRGRQTREQQISEADLRTRLGALAVSIFNREVAEIPRRYEVLKILSPFLPTAENNAETSDCESGNAFIQEVAEATGLLNIHTQEDDPSEDLITFMHYSFLEYYAAAGLLSNNYSSLLPKLSSNPRWRDVTTLLFGILSEQGDVTNVLKTILQENEAADAIEKNKLLLALECASECDVPPEAAQVIIAQEIYITLSSGVGRYSGELRGKIAERISNFMQGGGPKIESILVKGLDAENSMVAAAFIDLIARFNEEIRISDNLISAFHRALKHQSPVTRSAALFALQKRPELRTEAGDNLIRESLKGSVIEKHAALKTISAVPSYLSTANKEIRMLLDDPNILISKTAAQCMLAYALQSDMWAKQGEVKEKILSKLNETDQEINVLLPGITLHHETIENLIFRGSSSESELAIRYLALIHDDSQFVYQTLAKYLRTASENRHKAACLDSLRVCPGAMNLITIADTDVICSQLQSSQRNLRIAAIKLLGEMPDDEQVVSSLQTHLASLEHSTSKEEEITETAKALAKHVHRNQRLREEVLDTVFLHLPKNPNAGFGDKTKQHHLISLLLVCGSIGGVTNDVTAQQLLNLATNFRTPLNIRKHAMRVYGRLVEPSPKSIGTFISLLEKRDLQLSEAVYTATASFVSQCQLKVQHVRQVYPNLSKLRDTLCKAWDREIAHTAESIDPPELRDLRNAIIQVGTLMVAYEEFAERTKIQEKKQ